MSLPTLSLSAVRLLQLEAQGLLEPPSVPAAPADVLAAIRRMAALQIDTIHVVARSPYLVLFSRLGAYDPDWLDQLLAEGRVFEYWAHAACFLPVEDFRYFRCFMVNGLRGYFSEEYRAEHCDALNAVLEQVRAVGPVRSADFESEKSPGGWWNWKFEKEALEYWLCTGDVMVARRDKFQRVYDLRERVLPGWDDARTPSVEETYRALVLRSVRALGVAHPGWVWDYFRLPKRATQAALSSLLEDGALCEVAVEGWEEPGLALAESQSRLERAAAGGLEARYTTLLSPFDPLVWHRDRARQLFGFDFSLECYLPAAKRSYGYFLLPVLHRGALVGRLDAKAYRREGVFAVRAFYLEEGLASSPELAGEIGTAIRRCAEWHGTPQVRLEACRPEAFAPMLAEALA
jgi:uncharacterized protein YcaQ